MIGIPKWIEGHCIIKAVVKSYIKVQTSKNYSVTVTDPNRKLTTCISLWETKKIVESSPDLLAAAKQVIQSLRWTLSLQNYYRGRFEQNSLVYFSKIIHKDGDDEEAIEWNKTNLKHK